MSRFAIFSGVLALMTTGLGTAAEPTAQELFTTNCSACHMPDKMLVGPSLIEISALYKDKPDEFIAWCLAPQIKRKNVIEMPSMAHVGKENLQAIRLYILEASKGLTEKKVATGDKFADNGHGPKMQRIFMPKAGPAAIAVRLGNGYSLCWDAGACRLRYVWRGTFNPSSVYAGNGNSLTQIDGKVLLTEEASPLVLMKKEAQVKFQGYVMKDGLPTFRYSIDGKNVSERFEPNVNGYKRIFTIDGATSAKALEITEHDGVKTSISTENPLILETQFTK